MRRTSVAVAGIALLLSGWALTLNGPSQARATSGPVFRPPQRYYLALGDSLAYGIQPAKVRAGLPPSAFDTGYVDVFAARLRALAPKIRVVNYGCPRKSTKTFVAGGCPWLAGGRKLHNAFQGGNSARRSRSSGLTAARSARSRSRSGVTTRTRSPPRAWATSPASEPAPPVRSQRWPHA